MSAKEGGILEVRKVKVDQFILTLLSRFLLLGYVEAGLGQEFCQEPAVSPEYLWGFV